MEDPFAWWDAAAKRFRMLTHTFRMGMVRSAFDCLAIFFLGYGSVQQNC